MVCYTDAMKFQCSRVVLVVSVITIVMGALSCAFGVMAGGDMPVPDNEEAKKYIDAAAMKESFATIVLAGGVLCVITGIVGLLTAKMKNPFFAAPFIGLSFIIGLLLLIGAVMAGGDETMLKEVEMKICAKLEEAGEMKF